jgi:hypothetical protein
MPSNGYSRPKPGKQTSLSDVLVIQRTVFAATQEPNVKAADLASLARAWDVLEDRKRELRGRPKAGQLRPDKPKPHKTTAFTLPTEEP